MSDTPRTDAAGDQVVGGTRWVSADFARQLERENTELVAALQRIDDYLGGSPADTGSELYRHGVIEGNGDSNSLTPQKLVRAALAKAGGPKSKRIKVNRPNPHR